MAWSNPATWVAAAVLTAAQLNAQLRDNLKHIAGTAGFTATPSATKGIEPLSGYFLGALAQDMHLEAGTDTTAGGPPGTKAITFANAFVAASTPIVVATCITAGESATVQSVSNTGAVIATVGTAKDFNWMALGTDV